MGWRFHSLVWSLTMGWHGKWQREEVIVKFISKNDENSIPTFLLCLSCKRMCINCLPLWYLLEKQRRNQDGAVTLICLLVQRKYQLMLPSYYPVSTRTNTKLYLIVLCMQVCWNHGSSVFTRCMALCVAYDSGLMTTLFFFSFQYTLFSCLMFIQTFNAVL
jgi:hypothetical protein